jgi:hypothetical protein
MATPTFTLGLSEIQIGTASDQGTMPNTLTKIGMTYKDTCKLNQAASDITEHFEEGHASPAVRIKNKKMPELKFSIMDPDEALLAELVGGELVDTTKWGFDGTEIVANKAVRISTEQGLVFDIPNGDIEAVVNGEFSKKGIFLIDVTVTPLAVEAGKPILGYKPVVTP